MLVVGDVNASYTGHLFTLSNRNSLTLPLLVARIFTNNAYNAVAPDDFAFPANFFD
jgi:hypothetical protein